ncbi:MAG: hypothetical protein IT327_03025 [Anaerolineae bacterium]|nr:hypothetical protein [Anaerolineae bacterium]
MANEELGQFERLDMLEEARDLLKQVIELIEQVFPNDEYVKAYMIDRLKIRVGDGRGFSDSDPNTGSSHDLSIDGLIKRILFGEEG